LKPDVCLYESPFGLSKPDDILRMSKMPLLTIEILSPKQTIDDILNPFKAYFALNVQSCWLVIPILESITVYSQRIENFKLFEAKGETEVIDEGLDIRLPLQTKNIFKETIFLDRRILLTFNFLDKVLAKAKRLLCQLRFYPYFWISPAKIPFLPI